MKVIHDYKLENTCTCTEYDEETGDYTDIPAEECFGCWEDGVDNFKYATKKFMDSNSTHYYRIGGIKLWDREVGGIVKCETVLELIRAMAVNSEWAMEYTVHDECIEYSLSHHDAPMGSASFVRHATEEEIENSRW